MSGIKTWEGVRAEILRRIAGREWQPGGAVPGEEALAQEFGCARATVNRAMRELAEAGHIERRRKAGTRVALTPVRRATLSIPVIRMEAEGRGLAYSFTLRERKLAMPPAAASARLGLARNVRLLRLVTLHKADGKPFALEERWLNPAVLPDGANADFGALSVNEWLVRNISWSEGDIVFSAEPASREEAEALGCAPGAALFITERTTRRAEAPVTAVRLAYAPGYSLHSRL